MKKISESLEGYRIRVHNKLEDISEHIQENNEHNRADLIESRKSDDTDDYIDRIFHEPVALFFTRRFIKLGFSPNAVTILSMIFGVSGGVLFYPRNLCLNVLGILLEIFAAVLDCSDGQVARMTGKSSELGRVLDGTVDGVNFLSVYLALTLRMMHEPIPFLNGILWKGWIWPIAAFCGLYSHSSQARIADYYRVVHLFFRKGNDLQRSGEIYEEYQKARSTEAFWKWGWLAFYYYYTRLQEKTTPRLQKLLDAIDANNGIIPYGADSAYSDMSHKIIQMTNLLTFSLRAYLLYFLLLFDLHAFYFPFVIIIMGIMKHVMIYLYEKIADRIISDYIEK